MNKRAYVLRQKQTRNHTCHWPGCTVPVLPAIWGCKSHWFKLPRILRSSLWNAYVPGQEISLSPSQAYIAAAQAIQDWILTHV